MPRQTLYSVTLVFLLATLLAGCSAGNTPSAKAPTTAAQATHLPLATTVATAAEAPAPAQATTIPATPTDVPLPTTALPADVPWVLLNNQVYGDDEQLDFQTHNLPAPAGNIQGAPNGGYIAYTSQDGQLLVIETGRFTRVLNAEAYGRVVAGFAFSRDGRELAATLIDDQKNTWSLRFYSLVDGNSRELRQGSSSVALNDQLPLIPRPLHWAANGLLVDYVLWGTDAPPRQLSLINPADGTERLLRKEGYLNSFPAPDGAHVAIVTGQPGMGSTPTMQLAIVTVTDGTEQVIIPEQPGYIRRLRWSPNSARLLYASSADYGVPDAIIHMRNIDGSNEHTFVVGSASVAAEIADLAWQNNQIALMLLAKTNGYFHLMKLPIDQFSGDNLQPYAAYERGQNPNSNAIIIYTPGK